MFTATPSLPPATPAFHLEMNDSPLLMKINNSPYAKRPKGSRKSGLDFAQTFGTVRNIN
jgi:hypothetical protein